MEISTMTRACVSLAFAAMGCFGTSSLPQAQAADVQTSPTQPAQKQPDVAKVFARFHRFAPTPALPGHVTGVIVGDAYELMKVEGHYAGPKSLGFASGDGGYRLMLVPAPTQGSGSTMPVHVPPNGVYKDYTDVRIAGSDLKGFTPPFSIVNVEVNDGLGCPATSSFVATHLTVLNGTRYPLNPAIVMRDAVERYDRYKTTQLSTVDKHMSLLAPKALRPGEHATGPKQTKEHTFVTFLPESKSVQITFYWKTVDGVFELGRGAAPEGMHVYGRPPTTQDADAATLGVLYGVECAISFDYSVDGKLIAETPYPARDFIRHLNPQ